MDVTASLSAGLALLSAALFDPGAERTTDIEQTVLVFATNARLAVQSFVGLTITVTADAGGVERMVLRLTLLDDHVDPSRIETSLQLPGLTDGTDPQQPTIQVVLYAATPGAFVDLATDISFLKGRELDLADLDHHRGLALEPDITEVIQTESVVGEAIGVLVGRGRTRAQTSAALDDVAQQHTRTGSPRRPPS